MVNLRASLAALALAASLPALPPAARADLTDYRIGDIIREDIFAPEQPSAAALRSTGSETSPRAQRLHAVFRFNPKSPDEAEVSLRAAVIMARYHFLRIFQEQLLGRKPTEADLGSPAYLRTVAELSRRVPAHFPFDQLSPLWVSGQSEETFILTLAQPIRQTMANIIVDDATGSALPAGQSLRLITAKNLAMPLGIRDLDGPGLIVSPSKTLRLSQARQLVENNFPATQSDLARFAATFIRTNAQFDSAATAILEKKSHASSDTPLSAANPRQAILRKGQIVDRQTLEILAALREKNPGASFTRPAPPPSPREPAASAATPAPSPRDQRPDTPPARPPRAPASAFELTASDWTLIASVSSAIIALGAFYALRRARKTTTPARRAAPRPLPREELTLVDEPAPTGSTQRESARLTGAHAPRPRELAPSGALAWMKEKFVGTLFRHRSELLAAQQKARAEIEQLERRLEQLHAPLQQRIQAYEKRIAELEAKLADKGEINRHLLGASITLARQQLERSRFESN